MLAEIQTELVPVLHALYVHWMHGSTRAAARYRRLIGYTRSPSPQEQTRLTWFEWVAGKGTLEAVRQAERLEPLLLRVLVATSARLWERPQQVRADRLVRSLLPLACWRPELPGPVERERLIPQST